MWHASDHRRAARDDKSASSLNFSRLRQLTIRLERGWAAEWNRRDSRPRRVEVTPEAKDHLLVGVDLAGFSTDPGPTLTVFASFSVEWY